MKRSIALIVVGLILCSGIVAGRQQKPNEYQVKAAFLYNFGPFVEWPKDSEPAQTSSFDICVIGRDPFGPILDKVLSGAAIDGKATEPRRIDKPQDALRCHILFISSDQDTRIKSILDVVGKSSVLTVSDLPQFIMKGGMIQFVMAENRVRFEVNLAALEKAGLTVSSELLKVASAVRRSPGR